MGMFDYIGSDFPFPNDHHQVMFQTKDFDPGLNTIWIDVDGQLWCRAFGTETFTKLNTTVTIRMICFLRPAETESVFIEYNAVIVRGVLERADEITPIGELKPVLDVSSTVVQEAIAEKADARAKFNFDSGEQT